MPDVKELERSQKWQKRVEKIVNALKNYDVKKIVLFGSRARGDYLKNSDIDLAIDGHFSPRQKRKIKEKIDEQSGLYSVDTIFFDEISSEFRKKIESEGIVLYKKE